MFPQHKRVAQLLRETFGQGDKQRQQSSTSPDSGSGATSQPGQSFSQESGETETEGEPLPETDIGTGSQQRRKRGRPKKKLNPSASRGAARLLVDSDKPLKQIEEAFDEYDGPGRLWLRGFWKEISEGVRGSRPGLKWLRFHNTGSIRSHDVEDDGDDEEGHEGPSRPTAVDGRTDVAMDARNAAIEDTKSGINNTHNDTMNESTHASDPFWTELEPTYGLTDFALDNVNAYRPELLHHTGQGFTSSDPDLVLGPNSASNTSRPTDEGESQQTRDGQQKSSVKIAGRGQAQNTSVQFSIDPTPVQERGQKNTNRNCGGLGNKLKRKRRSTSLSLSKIGIYLDGGKKGRNYDIAKKNTISSALSSKLKDANSEFKTYYHRPSHLHINYVPPTPSTFPSHPSALFRSDRNLFPPEAVVIRALRHAWSHGEDDLKVRDTLEEKLPTTKEERRVFVNRKDNNGTSPLHLAVAYGYPHTCTFLMEHGADHDVYTNKVTSISEFAEPALRLTGNDHQLYFRIYYSRSWVKAGLAPPVGPRSNAGRQIRQPNQQPKLNQARAGDQRSHLARTESDRVGGIATSSSNADDGLIDTNQRQPSFTKEYTASPTTLLARKKHSLPFSGDDQSVTEYNGLNATPAVLDPSSAHFTAQPYTASTATAAPIAPRPSLTDYNNLSFLLQDPYSISGRESEDKRFTSGFGRESDSTRAFNLAQQQPNFANQYPPPQPQPVVQPSVSQGGHQWIPSDVTLPPQPTMQASSTANSQYENTMPAQAGFRSRNVPIGGMGNNFQFNEQGFPRIPPNYNQGNYSQPPTNDQGSSVPRSHNWRQPHVYDAFPNQRPPYVPPAMQQQGNPLEAPLPIPISAYHSDYPIQYPASGVTNSNVTIFPWRCPFGVAGCNGYNLGTTSYDELSLTGHSLRTCEGCFNARLYDIGNP